MSQRVKDLQPRLVPLIPSLTLGELIPRRRPLALNSSVPSERDFNRLSQVQLSGEAKGKG